MPPRVLPATVSKRRGRIFLPLSLCATLALCAVGLSVRADPGADVEQIQQLYADYRVAVEGGSIDGYVAVLHPQVRLLPPGTPAIDGAEHYASFLEPVFATAEYRIDVERGPEISVVGDLATAEYVYVVHLSLKNPDVGVTQEGALAAQRNRSRYFDVLRRKEDGRWAIWRHSWTDLGTVEDD